MRFPQNAATSRGHAPSSRGQRKQEKEEDAGYNSGDELSQDHNYDPIKERDFREQLWQSKRLRIKKTKEDGNCLFRAVSEQVYGDQDMHDVVRKQVMDFMEAEREHYSQFVAEDFSRYIHRKRTDRCFGNNLEIQAIAELYNRPVEVYQYSTEPINIFHSTYNNNEPPIRLSYHCSLHYNAVLDPNLPAAGYGLGLPALKPGFADREQMDRARRKSEQEEVQRLLMEKAKEESRRCASTSGNMGSSAFVEDELTRLEQRAIEESRAEVERAERRQLEAILASSRQEYLKSLERK